MSKTTNSFAAVAHDAVAGANHQPHPSCRLDQQLVADVVAVAGRSLT